ncbi:uncharacterized protein GGS22DRAFT_192761 [Annulohypoxylon maeteangense]|uniref:uncharacterized protein n=1 Tax=Annulohypoxylon maeteangense TaxID=1927788 RepID=UPI0020087F8A|nr:uncharacterized protein GGS22DRAFT_192761 [Annulohypoxylon maeteangense]KAI0880924.1 hypothetical protein GGS22DRAFT_192761 [Annulohypoxylon maeteangense]
MQFSAIISMGLFAVALAQTSTPTPSGPPDLTTCQEEAGPYADACPKCNSKCENSSAKSECFNSLFTAVNYVESQCWQHGGSNCKSVAVNQVCGQ